MVKDRLTNIINEKMANEFMSFRLVGNEEIEELLEKVESLFGYFIKAKEDAEDRYEKFFNLHNRQIAVNCKRSNLNRTANFNLEDRIKKCEAEIRELDFHTM